MADETSEKQPDAQPKSAPVERKQQGYNYETGEFVS